MRMPNFYFHVTNGQNYPDLRGQPLADLDAAKKEAVQFTGDMLILGPDEFCLDKEWSVRVLDEARNLVFEVVVNARDCAAGMLVTH
jgi:hypothetical protein